MKKDDIPIRFVKETAYDSSGKEIEVPERYNTICNKNYTGFVKTNEHTAEFVYRPPFYSGPVAMNAKMQKPKELLDEKA